MTQVNPVNPEVKPKPKPNPIENSKFFPQNFEQEIHAMRIYYEWIIRRFKDSENSSVEGKTEIKNDVPGSEIDLIKKNYEQEIKDIVLDIRSARVKMQSLFEEIRI